MLRDFISILIPLFVVIDPAGTLPLFLVLTDRYSRQGRRQLARRATLTAAIVGVAFIIVGQAVFVFLHIETYDFQIAGGIVVAVLALLDLLSPGKPAVDQARILEAGTHELPADVGIVPLAVPLIVGPATMTTSLLLVATYGPKYDALYGHSTGEMIVEAMVILALVVNLLLLFAAMWFSGMVVQLIGRQALSVINKVVMILLMAIAISLIRHGITGIVSEMRIQPNSIMR